MIGAVTFAAQEKGDGPRRLRLSKYAGAHRAAKPEAGPGCLSLAGSRNPHSNGFVSGPASVFRTIVRCRIEEVGRCRWRRRVRKEFCVGPVLGCRMSIFRINCRPQLADW